VVIAALTLAIEFRGIEEGVQAGIPNRYAWQFAFGLTVSLIWLYIEILRLLWIVKMMFDDRGSSRRSWTPVVAATRASVLGLTAPSCCRGCGVCWSVRPRTGRWDGAVSTATVVLGHDGVGIPLGQVVLVGEPVGPVRELEQTGSFVDSC